MGLRLLSSESSTDQPVVTTAETVVGTLSGITTSRPGVTLKLKATLQITLGANTTGLTIRIRRDSLTGTVVNEANVTQIGTAAGSTETIDTMCDDPISGEINNATYVVTIQQAAATANGSVLYSYLEATAE